MKRQPTEAQKIAAQERRERFRGIVKTVAKMTEDERIALASKIVGVATCEGHALSIFNVCLLASQNPTVTIVGGFKQWLRNGRAVKRGEHGLMIWCPSQRRVESDTPSEADVELCFFPGTVFDISQTEEVA